MESLIGFIVFIGLTIFFLKGLTHSRQADSSPVIIIKSGSEQPASGWFDVLLGLGIFITLAYVVMATASTF